MAINKDNLFFSTFQKFNQMKLSANASDTKYTVGIDGEEINGEPDILWNTVVYIKETKQIWTHHGFYGGKTSNEEDDQWYLDI